MKNLAHSNPIIPTEETLKLQYLTRTLKVANGKEHHYRFCYERNIASSPSKRRLKHKKSLENKQLIINTVKQIKEIISKLEV